MSGDQKTWAIQGDFSDQRLPLGSLCVPEPPLVHLWYLDLGVLGQSLTAALGGEAVTSPGAVLDMPIAQLRVTRRFFLRMLLGAYLGLAGKDVSLLRGPRGKPVLDRGRHGGSLQFSLAKSGRRVLIGISGGSEVGVDLELGGRKPRNARDLAERFFTGREAGCIRELHGAERDAAFMRTWACKEAVAKASGHGIANRFCRFSVEAPSHAPPRVVHDEDLPADGWRIALMEPEAGYIAAVAVQQPALRVEAFRMT